MRSFSVEDFGVEDAIEKYIEAAGKSQEKEAQVKMLQGLALEIAKNPTRETKKIKDLLYALLDAMATAVQNYEKPSWE